MKDKTGWITGFGNGVSQGTGDIITRDGYDGLVARDTWGGF